MGTSNSEETRAAGGAISSTIIMQTASSRVDSDILRQQMKSNADSLDDSQNFAEASNEFARPISASLPSIERHSSF